MKLVSVRSEKGDYLTIVPNDYVSDDCVDFECPKKVRQAYDFDDLLVLLKDFNK